MGSSRRDKRDPLDPNEHGQPYEDGTNWLIRRNQNAKSDVAILIQQTQTRNATRRVRTAGRSTREDRRVRLKCWTKIPVRFISCKTTSADRYGLVERLGRTRTRSNGTRLDRLCSWTSIFTRYYNAVINSIIVSNCKCPIPSAPSIQLSHDWLIAVL